MSPRISKPWRPCPICGSLTDDTEVGIGVVYWVCTRCKHIWKADMEEVHGDQL